MKKMKEIEDYRTFTKPAELHKAVNTLKGLVAGITTDYQSHQPPVQLVV